MHKFETLVAAGVTFLACLLFIIPWAVALAHMFRRLP